VERAAILVDELNAMEQLHELGIQGFKRWNVFYRTIQQILADQYGVVEVSNLMYTASPEKSMDLQRYHMRLRFFNALGRDGIDVKLGHMYERHGRLQQKGVDMMLGLDLFQLSQQKIPLLFIFSSDGDFAPAIEKARENGSRVIAMVSEKRGAESIRQYADEVLTLETFLKCIPKEELNFKEGSVVA
jgi:uncharacterized LabA/DUF88 family protein